MWYHGELGEIDEKTTFSLLVVLLDSLCYISITFGEQYQQERERERGAGRGDVLFLLFFSFLFPYFDCWRRRWYRSIIYPLPHRQADSLPTKERTFMIICTDNLPFLSQYWLIDNDNCPVADRKPDVYLPFVHTRHMNQIKTQCWAVSDGENAFRSTVNRLTLIHCASTLRWKSEVFTVHRFPLDTCSFVRQVGYSIPMNAGEWMRYFHIRKVSFYLKPLKD